MDLDPILFLEGNRLSKDLALAQAWSSFVFPTAEPRSHAWAVRLDQGQILMVVGGGPGCSDLFAHDLCTNRALSVLGYETEGPLSAWKRLGMNVFPAVLSSHARLHAVEFFNSKGLRSETPK